MARMEMDHYMDKLGNARLLFPSFARFEIFLNLLSWNFFKIFIFIFRSSSCIDKTRISH